MTEMEQVQEKSTAAELYGSGADVKQMTEAIRRFAAWANDPDHPMSSNEVIQVVMRAKALGLDPLNTHEVQIWKDKHGVHMQEAYTLIVEWVRRFKGEHTTPQYRELTAEEKRREGIDENDIAIECRFLMYSDLDQFSRLAQAVGEERALQMLQKRGVGVVSRKDWNNPYFAPNGRSRRWKAEKRALTDAYRRTFGTPSRAEIEEMRRTGALGADAIPGDKRDERDTALPVSTQHRRGSLFKTEEARAEMEAEAQPELVEKLEPGSPEPPGPVEGEVVEEEELQPEPEETPIPAWVESVSWSEFKAEMVRRVEHYTHEKHVINALRKARGEDYRPWLNWSPEVAVECYRALTERLDEMDVQTEPVGQQGLPW